MNGRLFVPEEPAICVGPDAIFGPYYFPEELLARTFAWRQAIDAEVHMPVLGVLGVGEDLVGSRALRLRVLLAPFARGVDYLVPLVLHQHWCVGFDVELEAELHGGWRRAADDERRGHEAFLHGGTATGRPVGVRPSCEVVAGLAAPSDEKDHADNDTEHLQGGVYTVRPEKENCRRQRQTH